MEKIWRIILNGTIILFFLSCQRLPEDKLEFINSQHDVTDSLYVLRDLRTNILIDSEVQNCYIDINKKLVINSMDIGAFKDLISNVKVSDSIVRKIYSGNFKRLIFLMSYLDKNHISGYYIDYSYHIFVFLYREYEYGDRTSDSRSILFKDEFVGNLKNKFVVKDESNKLILAKYNTQE